MTGEAGQGVTIYSKQFRHDIKCGCCNWETSILYSLSTNDVNKDGLCAHCFLEMIEENGWWVDLDLKGYS